MLFPIISYTNDVQNLVPLKVPFKQMQLHGERCCVAHLSDTHFTHELVYELDKKIIKFKICHFCLDQYVL